MVGPGKPPEETKFTPDKRPPGGRRKGSKDGLRAHLNRILRKTPGGILPKDLIKVLEQKTGRKITRKQNAEILALVWTMKAAHGDARFSELISKICVKPFEKEGGDIYVNTNVNTCQPEADTKRVERVSEFLAKLGDRGVI